MKKWLIGLVENDYRDLIIVILVFALIVIPYKLYVEE